jgi:hypothetical protein
MTERVQAVLASLTPEQRQEVLTALLGEYFAAGDEVEREIHGPEGEIVGYLMPPGVRLCHLLGIKPSEMPPALAGPYYPGGYGIRMLERMAAEAGTPTEP